LALTSPTSGGRSACIVSSQTEATEFFFFSYWFLPIHKPTTTRHTRRQNSWWPPLWETQTHTRFLRWEILIFRSPELRHLTI
jgi:hypothetical protein